ncbi:MAG: S-adenosylmethionine:tRNA ribosyltransferase-isomerase [Bacteroidales bacterium]
MTKTREIRIEEFDYPLPDERIAKFPLPKRDTSKLLLYKQGEIETHSFGDITTYIPADSLMVFNNTKVIQARLFFQKATGAKIEIFCLEPIQPHDYLLSFQQTHSCVWQCMIGNLKKWKEGALLLLVETPNGSTQLSAERLETKGNTHNVQFTWDNPQLTFADLLDSIGELPIPPYLNRRTEESDKETYQTVYSKIEGSVAAPTAGLHFTPHVLDQLTSKNVDLGEITLHVGAGTFQPVKSDQIAEHEMHTEFISVERSLIEKLLHHEDRVIAVGTTSVRTLESLYYIGNLIARNPEANSEELKVTQWMPYNGLGTITTREALQQILDYLERKQTDVLMTSTQIMIAPGYQFHIVKGIVTNFHQPKSTLLLLVSAFLKGDWKRVYDYALANDFRFLSYGDSSLLLPEKIG